MDCLVAFKTTGFYDSRSLGIMGYRGGARFLVKFMKHASVLEVQARHFFHDHHFLNTIKMHVILSQPTPAINKIFIDRTYIKRITV